MGAPAEITNLMTNTVTWERFIGQDGHAVEKYAAPLTVPCWFEEKGMSGGTQRVTQPGKTTMQPLIDIYMDCDQIDASEVTLRDRFTYFVNGQKFFSQPDRLNIGYGPDGSPWTLVVTL